IKLAMNKVEARLRDGGYTSRLLLQVHDELVLEVTNEEKDTIEALLKECMESVVQLAVPLIVDVHSAATWADVK
ncbi:DNA polymerase, partial [uncultured Veillonella sp.]|uniref:DNA polymerase n=1 Tax=uncultured Veillonella sp. TaxID=159268 RepID=UPI00258F1B32